MVQLSVPFASLQTPPWEAVLQLNTWVGKDSPISMVLQLPLAAMVRRTVVEAVMLAGSILLTVMKFVASPLQQSWSMPSFGMSRAFGWEAGSFGRQSFPPRQPQLLAGGDPA